MAQIRQLLDLRIHREQAGLVDEADTLADLRRDAQVLLCAALDKPLSYLMAWPEADVPDRAESRFREWMARRLAGEPVAYLTGRREFWSLPLTVSQATLIPRPDTEVLIERALALELSEAAAVLDLGTGSGAIALALASERLRWSLTATDVSQEALAIARENASQLGFEHVQWVHSNWFDAIGERRFDLIVSNPPYLEEGDGHLKMDGLSFEPIEALVAGPTGLEDLTTIIDAAPDFMNNGSFILLEHGYDQSAAVRECLFQRGFVDVESYQDLGGMERVSGGRWLSAC